MISADEFIVRIIKPSDGSAMKQYFIAARKTEVEVLMKRIIWTVCKHKDVTDESTITGERLITTLKNYDTPEEKAKLRFVAQEYNNRDKPIIVYDVSLLRFSSECLT